MTIKNFSIVFSGLLVLLLVLCGCSGQGEKPKTAASVIDMEQWAKDEMAAWTAHDVDKILTFYTDDCVYEDMALGKVSHGKEEIRAFIKEGFTGSPDLRLEMKSITASGDHVCTEWIMSGTDRGGLPGAQATGKSFSVRGATVREMRGDKASRVSDYYDMASMQRQLGLLPPAMAADPFIGTWKLNAAKSKASDPSLMHKSETIKIVAQENGGIYTFDGEEAEGKAFHGVWSGKYDGKDYPFTGNPDADMTAARKISMTALVFVYRKDGKEVANWRCTISKDGKTMTATGKGKDAKGHDFTKDLVFDKQ